MRETCEISGRFSREVARKSSIHPLPALAKLSPRFPGSSAIYLTPNGPIPTHFNQCFDENVILFDLGRLFFRCFAASFSSIFTIFAHFQPRKVGSNRFPAALRVYWSFSHPKRTKFHPISIIFSLEIHFFQFSKHRNPLFPAKNKNWEFRKRSRRESET